jgi:hypothetical protein
VSGERVTHLTEAELSTLCANEECRHGRWEHGGEPDFDGECCAAGSIPDGNGYAFLQCYCSRFEPPHP